jgi:hypothetical protein
MLPDLSVPRVLIGARPCFFPLPPHKARITHTRVLRVAHLLDVLCAALWLMGLLGRLRLTEYNSTKYILEYDAFSLTSNCRSLRCALPRGASRGYAWYY